MKYRIERNAFGSWIAWPILGGILIGPCISLDALVALCPLGSTLELQL